MLYLNGKFYDEDTSSKHYQYGMACFETIMGLSGKLVFFHEHIERLVKSLELLGINREIDYKGIVEETIKRSGLEIEQEFFIKILVSDRDVYVKAEKIRHRYEEKGVKLGWINGYYQNELGFLKSSNYLVNILAREEASKNGLYEGIFTNRMSDVTEGSISNIFFVKDGVFKTPSLDLNILSGVTRGKIIEILAKVGVPFQEGHFKKEELEHADGIFITNSLMKNGLLWSNSFEGRRLDKLEIFHIIEKEYLKLVGSVI